MNNKIGAQITSMRLSRSREELLALVNKRKSVAINELSEMMEDVRNLIAEGFLQLVVSVYPWGAEFEVKSAYAEVGQRP